MSDVITLGLSFDLWTDEILSANDRTHWAVKARKTKALRDRATLVVRALRPYSFDYVRLVVRIGWPDARRRDAANLAPTLKALIDGIVDGGLLPDDSDRYLLGPDLRPYVARIRGRVRLDFDFYQTQREETSNPI